MQPRLRRIGPIVLAILLALDGCATGKFTTLKPEQLGRVGIVPAPCADVHLGAPPIPGAGAGAKRGAKVGALAMVESGAKVGGTPQSVLLGLAIMALTPVGAGVGAVAGALGAESGEKVASANSTLRAAFPRLDPAHAIRQQLLEVIRARALRSVVLVDEKRVSELTDFAPLEEEGIDTVLELFKITIRLAGPDSPERHINPKYKFKMEIHARLLRPDGSRLHEKTFDVTAERTFVDWAAHDARELVGVTDRATRELAEDIVDRYLRKPVRVDPSLINQTPAIPGRCPPRPTGPELGIPVTRD